MSTLVSTLGRLLAQCCPGLGAGAVVVGLLTTASTALAQPRVAIVAAAAGAVTDGRFTDPQAKLQATGLFSAVDIINASSPNPTPTLATLLDYDAILVWTNMQFTDLAAMGDVLADYVDAGGGVVAAVFVVNSTSSGLQGRWLNEDYAIFVPASGNATTNATLGAVALPGHPILEGVNSLTSNTNSRANTSTLTSHGVLVISWSDGKALAAISSRFPGRVDLGMYPPSNAVSAGFWDQTTDGGRLMANALLYAANPVGTPGADLAVTVTGPSECAIPAGSEMAYTVRVRNFGNDASGPVTLTVDLPAASIATFAGSMPVPSMTTPTQVIYDLAAIGGSQDSEVQLTLNAVGAGETATVTATAATTGDTNSANNTFAAATRIRPAAPTSAMARAILSTEAELANATVPGGFGVFTVLDRPFASPSGNWWIIRADTDQATSNDLVMVRSQSAGSPSLILQEGVSSTINGTLGLFDVGAEVNDAGTVVFSGDDAGATTSDEFVGVVSDGGITDIAREGSSIPSIAGVTYGTTCGAANILANGQAGFSFTTTPSGSTGYFTDSGTSLVAQLGVTQPAGAIGPIGGVVTNTAGDGGFAIDATGAHSIYQANISGELTASDQVIVADGAVVLQEGVTVLPGLTSSPNSASKVFTMGPTGVWMVRGSNSIATEDWVVRGTGSTIERVYKVGDPIFAGAAETWQEDPTFTGTFFMNAADGHGNVVVGGVTSAADDFADAVLVLNDQVVLARENDPVDLDGNGVFDDAVYIRSFGNDDIAFVGDAVLVTITYRN